MALPQTPEQGLEFLSTFSPSQIRLGLERIDRALEFLGHPERNFTIVHVAGTNGKGSTCAFIASCLAAANYRVGLYTSPHLVRVNERFRINGRGISDELLGQRVLEVAERYPEIGMDPPPLTYFELGTLVALWHFARERVQVGVLETGLGGRLDATTATRPTVTAITPISFDHMDYLGSALAEIAREKAGILKPNVPVILSRQPTEALSVVADRARQLNAPLYQEGRDFEMAQEPGGALLYRGIHGWLSRIALGLKGRHQWQNAAVALACLELLRERDFRASPDQLRHGLRDPRWPGRLEQLGSEPPLIFDGAHNPAGIDALVAALEELYPRRRIHLVFGVLRDKQWRAMISRLFPLCASVQLVAVPSPRSLQPAEYLSEARELCSQSEISASPAEALAAAQRRAAPAEVILCAGSFYLVGCVRDLLGKQCNRLILGPILDATGV
jgi:dihydrofolate synthase / folylpolyglutamate synthase